MTPLYVQDSRRTGLIGLVVSLAVVLVVLYYLILNYTAIATCPPNIPGRCTNSPAGFYQIVIILLIFPVLSGWNFFRGKRFEFYEDSINVIGRLGTIITAPYSELFLSPLVANGRAKVFRINWASPDRAIHWGMVDRQVPSLNLSLYYWLASKTISNKVPEEIRNQRTLLDRAWFFPFLYSLVAIGAFLMIAALAFFLPRNEETPAVASFVVGIMIVLFAGPGIFVTKRAKSKMSEMKATALKQGEFHGDVIKALQEQARVGKIKALKNRPKAGALFAAFFVILATSMEFQFMETPNATFETTLPFSSPIFIIAIAFLIWGLLGPRKARELESKSATVPS